MEVARNVARYLRANPLACDTLEGIGRWWPGAGSAGESVLATALSWMRDMGIIEESMAADGRVRYRRAALDAGVDAALDQLIHGDPP